MTKEIQDQHINSIRSFTITKEKGGYPTPLWEQMGILALGTIPETMILDVMLQNLTTDEFILVHKQLEKAYEVFGQKPDLESWYKQIYERLMT